MEYFLYAMVYAIIILLLLSSKRGNAYSQLKIIKAISLYWKRLLNLRIRLIGRGIILECYRWSSNSNVLSKINQSNKCFSVDCCFSRFFYPNIPIRRNIIRNIPLYLSQPHHRLILLRWVSIYIYIFLIKEYILLTP